MFFVSFYTVGFLVRFNPKKCLFLGRSIYPGILTLALNNFTTVANCHHKGSQHEFFSLRLLCDVLLQMSAVFEACARYMEQQLDDTNCLGILSFARMHHCQHLCTKAMEHTEKNFQQVIGRTRSVSLSVKFQC